ncbi:peptidase U32 family protein [Desulfotalea psychrophila]|uniref:Probable protease n=1 Tax=Desulfotalea psychrophila (strain LSv54 / DSM 12343) TaxID=177439 RepID=Q6AIZ8_DESPS|nr:U32 family peptidase [Desulfotalea psychrophila]CAG37682.1 probable protease [Desulfotalea psychrophila LSv54]
MNENKSHKAVCPAIPELLVPAGNYEKLVTAVHYGADAIYLGGKDFSLRAKAGNFSENAMQAGLDYAHRHGVKVYITANIIAHNRDFSELDEYLLGLEKLGVDGLIISDPGILRRAQAVVPSLPIHLSTQANVTNSGSAAFWFEQGASRLNLARELSLKEITEIREENRGELEVFVHGALCISYSGRCMLSNYLTGRDANQGSCAHPCRYSYSLVEEKRPGEFFPVEEDERGTYIFNSKDLCLLEKLPQLVAAGVDSLKIEGRMKSIFYVGGVVRIYRAALDYLATLPAEAWADPEEIRLPEHLLMEIARTGTRGQTENFIIDRPGSAEMLYNHTRLDQEWEPVAVVRRVEEDVLVELRNPLELGDEIEYMGRDDRNYPLTVRTMTNEKGEEISRGNPGNRLFLQTEPPLAELAEEVAILRRQKR